MPACAFVCTSKRNAASTMSRFVLPPLTRNASRIN
jgi:hypothetical protein